MRAHKKFSKALFERNDAKARKITKEFYAKRGIELRDNPDKYGVDLIRYEGENIVGYTECEIKNVWREDNFPYGSVQFPERKGKFAYTTDLPVEFFMLNAKCNRALIVDGKDLLRSPLREIRNVYVSQGEAFFQVPLKNVQFYEIE